MHLNLISSINIHLSIDEDDPCFQFFQRVENIAMRLNKLLQLLDPRLKHYRTLPTQNT